MSLQIISTRNLPSGISPTILGLSNIINDAIDCGLIAYLPPKESVIIRQSSGALQEITAGSSGALVRVSAAVGATVSGSPSACRIASDSVMDAAGFDSPILTGQISSVKNVESSSASSSQAESDETVAGSETSQLEEGDFQITRQDGQVSFSSGGGDFQLSTENGQLALTAQEEVSDTGGDGGGESEEVAPTGFCGTEERVSTHTCNSVHPSLAVDPFGNIGVAWHDTRDGTHEIYFRTLASKISQEEALEALAARNNNLLRTVNLNCPFPEIPEGSGPDDLTPYDAALRCNQGAENSGALVRSGSGRLDVDVTNRAMVLSALDDGINFFQAGVQPGSVLRIENGNNSGLEMVVARVIGTNVLDISFRDRAVTDSGFSFVILSNPTESLTTCETRLTCSSGTSVFPSIVADRNGRFHIVYHSSDTGENQLYYVQLAPRDIGIKDGCEQDALPINIEGGFGEVPVGTPGSFTFIDDSDPGNIVERAFLSSGKSGDFFSYGNRFLIPAPPNNSPFLDNRTGEHRLFRDFAASSGKWAGVSLAKDRDAWNAQMAQLNQSVSPDVVFSDGHPIADEGDFGTRFDSRNLAFMVQTPPAAGVIVRTIALPINPKCSPRGPAGTVELREQDLVQAPKRPLPPSFEDPVDLNQILNGPNVTLDGDVPGRFVIEGDAGGTVFTNVIQEDARGRLSRLVFRKDTEGEEVKFILGQQACGNFPCGVRVPEETFDAPVSNQYEITLQVWQGSDYRLDPDQIDSASMSANLVFQKDFRFDQNEEISAFAFADGELVLPEGAIIFFVPIAGVDTEFTVEGGVGGGTTLWLTDSDGMLDSYRSVPFTLRPYTGVNLPVYYDGTLVFGQAEAIGDTRTENSITTRTALVAASVAFGQKGDDDTLATAYALSQGFTLPEERTVTSILLRTARGTSAGRDENGNSISEDPNRTLVVEVFDDKNGTPGDSLLFAAEIPAQSLREFDDFENIPLDQDMADLAIGTPELRLEPGSYHVVLREDGDADAGGRFWVLSGIDGQFQVGPASWNSSRPIDQGEWRTMSGEIQMTIFLLPEGDEEV